MKRSLKPLSYGRGPERITGPGASASGLFCAGRVTVALLAFSLSASARDGIASFWKATLARLAAEPIEATVEDTREPLPFKKYRIDFRSLDGVRVRDYLAMPVRGGDRLRPVPAIITVPGYREIQQGLMLDECQRGYAILQVFPRSQGPSRELWKIDGPDKLTWHLDKPEGAYYQGAYADVIRGVDYLVSRGDIDANRIAIAGTSQGGGIALAVASLDPRLKAVAAHVPFLCGMRQAARTDGALVKKLLDDAHVNDEAHLRALDYFDPLQLAENLKMPALVSSGGLDTVCPAATIRSVFDRIPGVKVLFHDPALPHTTSETFYSLTWLWLDRYLRP